MEEKIGLKQTAGDGSKLYQSQGSLTHVENNTYYSNSYTINYSKLAEEYKKETTSDIVMIEIVSKLQHFITSVDSEFIGLEQKLINGGFQNELQFANLLKEQYTKYLTSNNLSKAGQKIHAFLLARIFVAFNMYIPEAINEGRTNLEIKQIILERIVQPVEDVLGVDNVLELYQDDVMSMVYFLTGNCHIKWEGDVSIPPSI
jgi:hypothetical protein